MRREKALVYVARGPGELKNDLQQQLQEVEQKRDDLLSEHQRVEKRSQASENDEDISRTGSRASRHAGR